MMAKNSFPKHVLTLLCLSFVVTGCVDYQQDELSDLFADQRAELKPLPAPEGLRPNEVAGWNALSPARQHEARDFMKAGGSFADFLAV